ncbi:MAG: DUF4105 domain-containing protein [Muribaculaceae bacterium]|nr:DUF4105 domain-containing protein [Muribaculaceae bacterium]
MQRLRKYYLTTVLCALCATGTLDAAPELVLPNAAEAQEQEDSVRVSLVTFYPGSEPHNIWGHSEIRVQQGPIDLYFNYGVFDFQAPAFMWRFMLGQTDYLCIPVPRAYATMGMEERRMVEQELNLPQDRALAVRDFLWNNAKPENRTYRYKFLSDNCSTRPRDIIEMAAGESLQYPAFSPSSALTGISPQAGEESDTSVTYRDILAHYCRNYAWERFGIDLVLGWDIDTVIDQRATMFIPMLLMDAVAGATITVDGVTMPLVKATTVPIDKSTQGNVRPPTPWYLHPLTVAVLMLALTLLVSGRDWRRHDVSRWFDTVLFTIGGMAGCLLFFLVFFSTHEATSPNINIAWLHPLLLLLAVLPWFKKTQPAARWLHALNALVVALLMLAWPWQPQVGNIAFFPLMAALVTRSLTNVWLLGKTTRGPTPAKG